jgi:ATP-dependent Clp protease ATP-binding subunit ClpC
MKTSSPEEASDSQSVLVTRIVIPLLAAIISILTCGILAPFICLICVGGMVVIAVRDWQQRRADGRKKSAVDYRKLAATDMNRVLPWLKNNVRGHDLVIEAILQHLKKGVQLARPGRTLGNFLLVGPTGTGKTFLSQLVGAGLFPQSELVLLNMNQFRQPGDVLAMIGPPRGMPGHEAGGRLTRPVLQNPYRVVVFAELEKAHRDLHDCLYDILDTATCREKSSGQLVDFSGCVFFATSNAGVEKLRLLSEEVGSATSSTWLGRSRDVLVEAAKFDRAFLSRWDGVYLLDQLPPIHVAEVACLQLCRYWREYGIEVGYMDPELILETVQRNQEFSEYGVRQLGRLIREMMEPAILEAKRKGATKVNLHVGARSGEWKVEVPKADLHVGARPTGRKGGAPQ